MSKYILSTMTNSVSYTVYQNVGNLPTPKGKVTIHGGANIPSMRSGFGDMSQGEGGVPMWTAAGVVTPVSDQEFELLKDHVLFNKHLEKGFVKVINHDITGNHKEIKRQVVTMQKSDGFATLDPTRLKQNLKVTTGAREIENDAQFRL